MFKNFYDVLDIFPDNIRVESKEVESKQV